MALSAALGWLARHAAVLLAGGVFVGLAAPPLAALLRPLLIPAIVLILALALVRIDWRAMASDFRRPGLMCVALAWLMGAAPVLVWLLTSPLPLPPGLVAGLTLMTAGPPIMAAAAFALIIGLDAPLAVVITTVGTVAAPLTLPPLALLLFGIDIDIGLTEFSLRLGLVIGGSFALAYAARRLAPPGWIDARVTDLAGLSVVVLLVFAIGIMDGVTEVALVRPGYVIACVAAAFVANLALQAAGALAFAPLGRRRALTLGLTTGNRNMGVVLAALAGHADFDIIVFFAVAQLPMYILPALLRPLYRRLLAT